MTEALGPEHPHLAVVLTDLASLSRDQRRHAEAEPLYQRALAITESAFGPGDPHLLRSLEEYGELLREMGREGEAAGIAARADAIRGERAEGSP